MPDEKIARSMLARGLSVLRCFRPGDTELALAEIARRADMPKPTAHRIITELIREGMLERGEEGLRLGVGLFLLGVKVPRQLLLRELAFPYVERLHQLARGSAFVYISDAAGPDAGLVDAVRRVHAAGPGLATAESWASGQAATRVFQMYGTGSEALRQGAVTVRSPAGAVGVAAPVLAPSGAVIGALAVAGPAEGFDVGRAASHLRTACASVARALHRNPRLPQLRHAAMPRLLEKVG